jgi:hypothetical protein
MERAGLWTLLFLRVFVRSARAHGEKERRYFFWGSIPRVALSESRNPGLNDVTPLEGVSKFKTRKCGFPREFDNFRKTGFLVILGPDAFAAASFRAAGLVGWAQL